MTDINLQLDYSLGEGWLEPWLNALKKGDALGRKCDRCDRVSFVPLRVCECGSDSASWVALTGKAQIKWRTKGTDGEFALARLEGADMDCVVRIVGVHEDSKFAKLRPPTGETPMLALEPLEA